MADQVHTLRVITLNLWKHKGDVRRRMEIASAGLRQLAPDVLLLQEVVEQPGGLEQAQALGAALGAKVHFAVTHEEPTVGPTGNAVLSRWPTAEEAVFPLPAPPGDGRLGLAVDVITPAGRVGCISTHLSWELDAAPVREAQVLALDAFARGRRRELPSVLGGDFNAPPESQAIRFLTGRAALAGQGTYWRDAFAARHPHADGHTWSSANPAVVPYVERDRRIDYVFVGPMGRDRRGAILDARVVLDVPAPDGVYASDHFGVLVDLALTPPVDQTVDRVV